VRYLVRQILCRRDAGRTLDRAGAAHVGNLAHVLLVERGAHRPEVLAELCSCCRAAAASGGRPSARAPRPTWGRSARCRGARCPGASSPRCRRTAKRATIATACRRRRVLVILSADVAMVWIFTR